MNSQLRKLMDESGIRQDIGSALAIITADRSAATPHVLLVFTGYSPSLFEPNESKNMAVLAIIARMTLTGQFTPN